VAKNAITAIDDFKAHNTEAGIDAVSKAVIAAIETEKCF
jgi:hypothetical protein